MVYALKAEDIWKGDILVADIEELEQFSRVRNLRSEASMQWRIQFRRDGDNFKSLFRKWKQLLLSAKHSRPLV